MCYIREFVVCVTQATVRISTDMKLIKIPVVYCETAKVNYQKVFVDGQNSEN